MIHLEIIFRKISSEVLCHPWSGLFVSSLLSLGSSLYILAISHLSDLGFANIFSISVACLFTLLLVSFDVQKLLLLMRSSLSVFSFVAYAFGIISKKSLPNPMSWSFFAMISSTSFTAWVLMFRSVFHFEFIFADGVKPSILSPFQISLMPVLPWVWSNPCLCLEFSTDSGAKLCGFESHLHCSLAVWLWASFPTSLSLLFLIYKLDVLITVPASSFIVRIHIPKALKRSLAPDSA